MRFQNNVYGYHPGHENREIVWKGELQDKKNVYKSKYLEFEVCWGFPDRDDNEGDGKRDESSGRKNKWFGVVNRVIETKLWEQINS